MENSVLTYKMKIHSFFIAFLFLFLSPGMAEAFGQGGYLSEQAEISLLTCDPGTEVYSVFGHTALRVADPVNGFDVVYNFGTFDFSTPNFYLKFIRGRLMYTLSRYNFSDFKMEYRMEKRSIFEQKLNLSQEEKDRIFYLLEVHYLPENRYYLYDFFFINCTTKVLDLIDSALNDPEYFSQYNTLQERTFRQNLAIYLKPIPWTRLGIDLMLGLPADKIMTVRESMFLPLELMQTVDREKDRDLFDDIRVVYQAEDALSSPARWYSPSTIFWAILLVVLVLTFFELKKEIRIIWPDMIFFSIIGLQGILLALLWAFSDHDGMHQNLNVLWAFPLHFPVFLIQGLLGKRIFRAYILVTGVILLLTILLWKLIPQEFNPAMLPLMLILLVRLVAIFWRIRRVDSESRPT